MPDDSGPDADWVPSGEEGEEEESSAVESEDHRVEDGDDAEERTGPVQRAPRKAQRGGLAMAGKIRIHAVTAQTKRRKMDCPLEGCPAKIVNIRRHLKQIHAGDLPVWRMNQLVGKAGRKRIAGAAVVENEAGVSLSRLVSCPICNRAYKRLDRHLKTVHSLDGAQLKAEIQRAKRAPAGLGSPIKSVRYQKSLLAKFKTWLTSRGGANAPEAMASAAVSHVNRILSLMVELSGSVSLVPATLLMLNTLGDRNGLLAKIEKRYGLSLDTMSNYTISAGKFSEFLGHDWALVKPWSSKEDFLQLAAYIQRVKLSMSKERRQVVPEDRPRTVLEDDLPEVDDVKKYFSSETAKEMIRVLNREREYDTSSYSRVISHLFLELCFTNAKRAGDFCNLRLAELASAKAIDGQHIVRIAKHKVMSKACLLAMTPNVFTWLLRTVTVFKPETPSLSPRTYVLVNPRGNKLTPSDVVTFLNVQWELYGQEIGKTLPRLTTTVIRKVCVSLHGGAGSTVEEEHDLALLMAHDRSTAE